MCSFQVFLDELYNSTKIPFRLEIDGQDEIVATSLDKSDNESIYVPINVGGRNGKVITSKGFENCTSLLKYCIESKLKEIYLSKEEIVLEILRGRDINNDLIELNLPMLLNEFYIINIFIEDSNQEVVELIRAGYEEKDIISMV